jgi:hypothetical protein
MRTDHDAARTRRLRCGGRCALALVAAALAAVAGCVPSPGNGNDGGDPNATGDPPPVVEGQWARPAADATWQWQLQPDGNGQINTAYEADVYDIDLFDAPAAVITQLHAEGRIVIAYFSAGTYEGFRDDAGSFAASDIGQPLADFPDERWLDVRSSNVRAIMQARLDLAAARGFDGVEPDNVDGYANNSGFNLTAADQLEFNRFLANEAHQRGLAVGLKNDLDQVPALVSYFDFAVNEECHAYDECDALQPFVDAGKPVFNAEYDAALVGSAAARATVCAAANALGIRTLILPLDLDDEFRLECE